MEAGVPLRNSSLIKSRWYSAKRQELVIVFNFGGSYVYENATPEFVERFNTAPSLGRFFLQNIKGKNPYRKIEALANIEDSATFIEQTHTPPEDPHE